MPKLPLSETLLRWLRRPFKSSHSPLSARRGPRTHVIILDGTMSSLKQGEESNAGLIYKLLQDVDGLSLYYEAGIQWTRWRDTIDVMIGRGINRQIRRAYGFLASRYREGDRIYLVGYSRGAFAVRSLAGVIDRIGLLRAEHATERNVRQAYRLYQFTPETQGAEAFHTAYCHPRTMIEAIGAFDTVKALGLRLPLLWRLTEDSHSFHNLRLGACVKRGFHALALHETRLAYEPVLWRADAAGDKRLDQVWFRGTHGDVGGQLGGADEARPLSYIPLVWMLAQLHSSGLPLPQDWRARFPTDPEAPSIGTWKGFGKLFLLRKQRPVGTDSSERVHYSAQTGEKQAKSRRENKAVNGK